MYLIQYTAFLVLLHQCIGFDVYDIDVRFNYLNLKIDSAMSSFAPDQEVMTRWFIQEVDHFNSQDTRKWKMKYFEELRYWRENGPIYLFLGGEGPVSQSWARTGIMNELAQETNGAMYITEHRYYGDSKLFDNLHVENMKYLSSTQALADIAKFIFHLKLLPMYRYSKVVVIGGSYSGSLAAWMKVLYPRYIDAAIASSSPVLAKKDFYEYLEKVSDIYKNYGLSECLDMINNKNWKYDYLLRSPEGIKQLKNDENICDACDMTVIENQQLFFKLQASKFMFLSQDGSIDAIKQHCENFNYINYNRIFLNEHSKFNNSERQQCLSYDFNAMINNLKSSRNQNNMYPWLYQTCTEFGYYVTTTSKNQPFLNLPLEFYIKICSALFGYNFNERRVDEGVEYSNKLYGGLNPNVTNVVFTNGYLDPWSTISVLQNLYDAPAVVIPGAHHCQDLLPIKDKDSEQLKGARKYVKNLIKKWIGAYIN